MGTRPGNHQQQGIVVCIGAAVHVPVEVIQMAGLQRSFDISI